MAGEFTTKVRLVRCPKCRKVLPELPELNVYKCGGCDATLQAKNRASSARSAGSGSNDVEAVQVNQTDHVHEDKEGLGSSSKDVLPGLGECSPCENNERDQSRPEDCEDEQLGGTNLSSENQNNGNRKSDSSDCDNEGSDVSNEIFSPTEFVDHKNGEFGLSENDKSANDGNGELAHDEKVELADKKEEEIAHDQSEEIAHDETEEFAHDENEDFTREDIKEFNEKTSHDEKVESTPQNTNEEPAHSENESSSLGAVLEVPVDDDNSPVAEANTVDTNKKSDTDSDVRTSNAVNSVAAMENGSSASSPMPVRVSVAKDTLGSSRSEQLKQPQKSVHQGYANLKSKELNPSSEHSSTLRDMSKSPTRTSRAYDGSISSCDGLDDQFPMRHSHPLEDTSKAKNFIHADKRPRRDKLMAQTMMSRESEMQHQARSSVSDKKTNAMKNGNWDRDKSLEPARHDRTVRNWRLGRHEYQPSTAFRRSTSRASYDIGGPSNRLPNEFHRRSSFQSHDLPDDHAKVMKLLKMVLEMQNQLDKSRFLYDKGNYGIEGLYRKPRYNSRYHNYEAASEERFHHSDYPRHYGRYGSGINYSNRNRLYKVPFSGEATRRTHQDDPSCSHCFPQDWQRSAQLPPTSHYTTSGLYRNHPGHNYCTSYSSFPSSPQWSMDSENPPWGQETRSDHRHCCTREMMNYLRENHPVAKRHFLPVAGAAPFIVCYKCFKLLQLPADFLLFKRKCHRLRCGACLEVLKFSLENGSHIAPYTADSVDTPPQSEAEDYGDEIDGGDIASAFQALHGGPVSYSNDHGLSHHKSYSTEGDPNSSTPFHTPLGRTFDKRILYGPDFTTDSKELAPEQSRGRYNNRVWRCESSGPSSNLLKSKKSASEIEKLPPRSTSPLHRLMGYSSPSEVIFGPHPSVQVPSSYFLQKEESRN